MIKINKAKCASPDCLVVHHSTTTTMEIYADLKKSMEGSKQVQVGPQAMVLVVRTFLFPKPVEAGAAYALEGLGGPCDVKHCAFSSTVFPDSGSLYVRGIQTLEKLPREQWQEESHPPNPSPHPHPATKLSTSEAQGQPLLYPFSSPLLHSCFLESSSN